MLSYLVFFACIVLILGVLSLALNLQWGFTGLFNAGVVGFYAIGAYTHAILTAAPQPQYIGKPLAQLFETPFGFNLWFLGLMIVLMATIYWALDRILMSPWGRVLKAIREDETAAIALGKSARRFRLEAFVLGSTLMGLAGALYVSFIGFVSPFDFLPILTFQVWAMLIVGGSGNNRGALLGALVVWAIWAGSGVLVSKLVPPSRAAQGAAIQVILIGLLLMVVLLFRPRGLIGEAAVVSRHVND